MFRLYIYIYIYIYKETYWLDFDLILENPRSAPSDKHVDAKIFAFKYNYFML